MSVHARSQHDEYLAHTPLAARTRSLRVNRWTAAHAGIAYSALVAAAITQTWFAPGKFIAAGDSGPMLDGLGGVTRSWTDSLAGTGSTGYRSASLPEGLVHDLVTVIGFSDTFAQRIWYTLVIAGCAAAVAWLAAAFTRHGAATTAAGLTAVLAPFHLTTLPNLLPAIAIASVALIGGWAIRSMDRNVVPPPAALLLAILFGPLAKNPPLLAMTAGCAAVAIAAVGIHRRLAVRYVARSVAWIGIGSLYWMVPLVVHYVSGTPGLEIVAQTDVEAWGWTQRNSGTANVLRLVASWVWGDAESLGTVAGLSSGVWPLIGWSSPLAVLASIAVSMKRRRAFVIGAGICILVVLCVGVNAPFGGFNRFLYDHLPGYWLFRQPMSKFGALLVVAYATLIAMGVDGLIDRAPGWRPGLRRTAAGVVGVLVIGFLAFSNPIWTGSVIHGQRGGANQLPPERVAVPDDWYRAGEWLDRAPLDGSVAVLPLSDYYQQGTDWGFYGVNDLVTRLTNRQVLNLLPGGYFEPAGAAAELLGSLQSAIEADDGSATVRLMDALGVAYVAIRTDLTTVPVLPTADASELLIGADEIAELQVAASFDHVVIYEATTPPTPEVRRAIDVPAGMDDARLADVVASAPEGVVVVTDDRRPGYADAWLPSGGVTSHEVSTSDGDYQLSTRMRAPLLWQATVVDDDNSRQHVRLHLRSTLFVDGVDLYPDTEVSVPVDGHVVALVVDGRPIALKLGVTLFGAEPGSRIGFLVDRQSTDVTDPSLGGLGNCNNRTGATLRAAGITATAVGAGIELRADAGSACLSVPAPAASEILGSRMWHVSGEFNRLLGRSTRVCLWLPAVSKCAAGTPPATVDESGMLDFVAATYAGEDATGASLVVYADHQAGMDSGTVATRFTNLRVSSVARSEVAVDLPPVAEPTVTRTYGDGATRFTIDPDLAMNLMAPLPDTVEDCNNYDDAPTERNGLSARRIGSGPDSSIELSARRHSACVSSRVDVPAGIRHLTLDFEYRAADPGARWCLRATGSACLASASLGSTDGWQEITVDVVAPDDAPVASADSFRLYVYADGAGPEQSSPKIRSVEYRRVSVRPTYPLVGVIQPLRSDAGSELVVVFTQAYAEGWSPTGPDAGLASSHQLVDGWANGWTVPLGTGADMGFAFGPDRLVMLAVWTLPAAVLAAGVSLLLSRLSALASAWRRRPGMSPPPPRETSETRT